MNFKIANDNDSDTRIILKRIGIIIACAVGIIPLWDTHSDWRYVGGFLFLTIIIQTFFLLPFLPNLLVVLIPDSSNPKRKKSNHHQHKVASDRTQKQIKIASSAIMGFGLLGCVLFSKTVENTLNGLALFGWGILIGFCCATIIVQTLKWISPDIFDDHMYKINIYVLLFVGAMLTGGSGAHFINSSTFQRTKKQCFPLISSNIGGKRGNVPWFFIQLSDGSQERIQVTQHFFKAHFSDSIIYLQIDKGVLGYWVVRKKQEHIIQ